MSTIMNCKYLHTLFMDIIGTIGRIGLHEIIRLKAIYGIEKG